MRSLWSLLVLVPCSLFAADMQTGDWPQFRGPTGQGHSPARGLPRTWSDTRNVTWKTTILGQGWSSPVVWGNQVWLTAAQEEGRSLRASRIDAATGRGVFTVEVFRREESLPTNPKNTHASPTPVIEEGRVYVHFGSAGTACLDSATGQMLWADNSHVVDHKEGPGSSPVLWEDKLIVNFDGRDSRFVVAFDKKTGKVAWKTDRSAPFNADIERNKAYCTPLIVEHEGRPVLINPGAMRVSAYDPANGKELWWCDYNGFSNVPRPVAAHGMVYICTGYTRGQLLALRLGGQGDVTESHVAWRFDRQVPNNASPIVVGDELYMVSDRGVLTCLDAKSGEELWTERVGGTSRRLRCSLMGGSTSATSREKSS